MACTSGNIPASIEPKTVNVWHVYWWELPYLGVVVCLDEGLSNLAGQHTIARIPLQCTLIHFQSSLRLWVGVLGEVVRVESDSTICYNTIMQKV